MSSKPAVSNEPLAVSTMDLYPVEKLSSSPCAQEHEHEHGAHQHQCNARRCHASRLKRVFLPALVVLLSLGALMAVSCMWDFGGDGMSGIGGLLKRATDGSTQSSGTFVDKKYYLIIIFVGLFLVVILGICLSAWCCKGSFENPLCCPCYLCACCGGLACLECIGCGLCAEGIDQM